MNLVLWTLGRSVALILPPLGLLYCQVKFYHGQNNVFNDFAVLTRSCISHVLCALIANVHEVMSDSVREICSTQ